MNTDDLTIEERAALTSGLDFWHTKSVTRDGREAVPSLTVADGPHGLRKQPEHGDPLGLGNAVPATCFPTASALGCTWNPDLLRTIGSALGREARANRVAVLLGPGINIKRSPLCGRNFEYLSEDPLLSGELGAAFVEGVQSQGVGTSLKHFAANNQETDRMRVSVDIDERTLREIYLAGFERVVTKAHPWTVMCSYNLINGVFASEHPWLLTEVLRDEWGFDGVVVSDWGAVNDRVAGLVAGLDLQMPGTGGRTDAEIVAAIRSGDIEEAVLDRAADRILRLIDRTRRAQTGPTETVDDCAEAHHQLARTAAAEAAVLLKNDLVHGEPVLPLPEEPIGVIGQFASEPRIQGAGSSQVNPLRVDDPLTQLRALTGAPVLFEPGDDQELAVALAHQVHTVVLFLGLPPASESEGYDREDIDLPADQIDLLAAVAEANPRTVVVLANGGVVSLAPWRRHAAAILETWLPGQAGAGAVADLLLGRCSPSGKLAETIPLRLEDNPSYGNFPGELGHVRYGEGVLVGYRGYDARDVTVAYPFGHGLSYTTFAYSNAKATVTGEGAATRVHAEIEVANVGDRSGAEVVQVYVSPPDSPVQRPQRELKAFAKIFLEAGERRRQSFELSVRDLSYWHPTVREWALQPGEYTIALGSSSRDIRASAVATVVAEPVLGPVSEMSTLGEALEHPVVARYLRDGVESGDIPAMGPEMLRMVIDTPLRAIAGFEGMFFDREQLADLLRTARSQ